MKDMFIIDNCIDEREFRNYIYSQLPKLGFEEIVMDDVRVSDTEPINDNDIKAFKDGIRYTIQTYLNRIITKKEIEETIIDMQDERVSCGAIISNKPVDKDVKDLAWEQGIEIIDRDDLCKLIKK